MNLSTESGQVQGEDEEATTQMAVFIGHGQ
jgi:hypothetical protein